MLANMIHAWNRGADLLRKMVSDISDDKVCEQPVNLPNHPLWQIGHLANVRAHLSKMGPNPVVFPAAWEPLFTRGSTPLGDRAVYPAMSMVMATFDTAHAAAVEALKSLTPEKLAGPHSLEGFKESHPALGDLLMVLTLLHDGMHAGQISDWRRAMKLPRVM